MRTYILSALGCVFWLVPLILATSLFWQYGFYEDGFGFNYDSLPLLGIPVSMTGLTLLLARFARHRPLPGIVPVGASLLAFCAAIFWLATWGKGV
jgi:hypothetical protein